MSKVIAIWGSPQSGKTTFAVRLAKAIYDTYTAKIICVSVDNQTPALPVLFPNCKLEDLPSVGAVLSKTEIEQDDMITHLVTVKDMRNIGFMGYSYGENHFSYPDVSVDKSKSLIEAATSLADFVIIDCSSDLNEPFNFAAISKSDTMFRLCSPTLKSISFFSSQLPIYGDMKYKLDDQIVGLIESEQEVYMPIEEAKQHFTNVRFTVPYCREIKQQMLDGNLLESVKDKSFNLKMKAIAEKVV
jgi:MinD-like ATPase involved in chromosome partitioning or flagellar assembly